MLEGMHYGDCVGGPLDGQSKGNSNLDPPNILPATTGHYEWVHKGVERTPCPTGGTYVMELGYWYFVSALALQEYLK